MNRIKHTLLVASVGLMLLGIQGTAQNKKALAKAKEAENAKAAEKPAGQKQMLLTVTTMHRNMDQKDLTMDSWKALEKEYLDKVVSKNEHILGQQVLTHYFTADNTELLLVTMYDSWTAIEKGADRTDALVKAAWPDEKARNAFFEKKGAYYGPHHSDEIYATYAGAKNPPANFTKSMLYYVRKSHWGNPKDGTEKEFMELRDQYLKAVTYKNDFVKAYYPNVHAWGADNTEFTEVFVFDSLSDVEKAFDKDDELFKTVWNDDAKSKDFNKKFDKYFTGVHGDYLYHSVPELSK